MNGYFLLFQKLLTISFLNQFIFRACLFKYLSGHEYILTNNVQKFQMK